MPSYDRLAEIIQSGEPASLATVIKTLGSVPRREGAKMVVFADGTIEGSVGGGEMESQVIEEALAALSNGQPRLLHYSFRDPEEGDVGVCGGEMDVFIEPIQSAPRMFIFGSGHVGRAIAYLAKWLGFYVTVADDREGYAVPELIPEADEYIQCSLSELPGQVTITRDSYIVLTTRGVEIDKEGLPALLDTEAAYIGVIGSKRRWEVTAGYLTEAGVPQEKIQRVTSPMGLELNAETPEEIALSILAQVILIRHKGTGEPMSHTPESQKVPSEKQGKADVE